MRTTNNRSLNQNAPVLQFEISAIGPRGGRFKVVDLDLSSGVFIGHIGHNSPYRVFTDGFGVWRFQSGSPLAPAWVEFDTFSIETIGDNPLTLAHVIDLNATPSRTSGGFDAADVNRIEYTEARISGSSSTNLQYYSYWTHAPSDGSANTPRIYGVESLSGFVRKLRNDNFATGLGGPTGLGKQTEAVENVGSLLTFNMPLAFGKTGLSAFITGSDTTYQIGKDWTLAHLTGQGLLWLNEFDVGQVGQQLDLRNSTINMLVPSDWTVFSVSSANVALLLDGLTINNAGSMTFGSSVTGAITAEVASGKVFTTNCAITDWDITGSLVHNIAASTLLRVSATELTINSATTEIITLDDCNIGTIINNTGNALVLVLTNGSERPTLSGRWGGVIEDGVLDAFSFNVLFATNAPRFSLDSNTLTVPDSRTEEIRTTGLTFLDTSTTLDVDVTNELRVSTAMAANIADGVNIGVLAISQGTAIVDISLLGTVGRLMNNTGAPLRYVGEPLALDGDWTQINPSSFTLSATADDSWAIYNDSGVRQSTGTGNTSIDPHAATDTGTWAVVLHRKGHIAERFEWTANDGSSNSFTANPRPLLRPDGGNIYVDGNTLGVIVQAGLSTSLIAQIPNRTVSAQAVIDAQQNFLHTNAGIDFMYQQEITSAPIWGELNGAVYFLNVTGFQYDSTPGNTPESSVAAIIVSSSTAANIAFENGGTVFSSLGTVDPGTLADAVWEIANATANTAGTMGESLQQARDHARAANTQTKTAT